MDDALGQRATLVGAFVAEGEECVVTVAKQRDEPVVFACHHACAQHGHVAGGTDPFPVGHGRAPKS